MRKGSHSELDIDRMTRDRRLPRASGRRRKTTTMHISDPVTGNQIAFYRGDFILRRTRSTSIWCKVFDQTESAFDGLDRLPYRRLLNAVTDLTIQSGYFYGEDR